MNYFLAYSYGMGLKVLIANVLYHSSTASFGVTLVDEIDNGCKNP